MTESIEIGLSEIRETLKKNRTIQEKIVNEISEKAKKNRSNSLGKLTNYQNNCPPDRKEAEEKRYIPSGNPSGCFMIIPETRIRHEYSLFSEFDNRRIILGSF